MRQAPTSYEVTAVIVNGKGETNFRLRTFEGCSVKVLNAGALVVTETGKRNPTAILNRHVWQTVERVEERLKFTKPDPERTPSEDGASEEDRIDFVPEPVPPSALDVELPETGGDWTGQSELADGRALPTADEVALEAELQAPEPPLGGASLPRDDLPLAVVEEAILGEGADQPDSPIAVEVDETEATGLKRELDIFAKGPPGPKPVSLTIGASHAPKPLPDKLIRKEPDPRAALHTPKTGDARGKWGSRFRVSREGDVDVGADGRRSKESDAG